MNVVFKEMGDIENPKMYPVVAKEMIKYFDGITIREVTKFEDGCYDYEDADRTHWLVHKDWTMEVNRYKDLDELFSMEL